MDLLLGVARVHELVAYHVLDDALHVSPDDPQVQLLQAVLQLGAADEPVPVDVVLDEELVHAPRGDVVDLQRRHGHLVVAVRRGEAGREGGLPDEVAPDLPGVVERGPVVHVAPRGPALLPHGDHGLPAGGRQGLAPQGLEGLHDLLNAVLPSHDLPNAVLPSHVVLTGVVRLRHGNLPREVIQWRERGKRPRRERSQQSPPLLVVLGFREKLPLQTSLQVFQLCREHRTSERSHTAASTEYPQYRSWSSIQRERVLTHSTRVDASREFEVVETDNLMPSGLSQTA
mmetsp:Transcript_34029/g.68694  ORF Transcript_34029/g.68694 Transcript_34029/m.68694 type:complete len:286 (+) Transcript_34029:1448-2305(+)